MVHDYLYFVLFLWKRIVPCSYLYRRGNSASKSTPSRSNTPSDHDSGKRRKSSSSKKTSSSTVVEEENDNDKNIHHHHQNNSIQTSSSNTNIWSLTSFLPVSSTSTTSSTVPVTSSFPTTGKTPRTSHSTLGRMLTANRRKGKTTYVIDGTAGTTEIDSNIATTVHRSQDRFEKDPTGKSTSSTVTSNTTTTTTNTRFGRLLQQHGIRLGKPLSTAATTTNTTTKTTTTVPVPNEIDAEPRPGLRIPTRTKPSPGTTSSTDTHQSFFSGLFQRSTGNHSTTSTSSSSSLPSNVPPPNNHLSLSPNPDDREIIGIDDDVVILQPRKGSRTSIKPARKSLSPLPSYNEPDINLTPIPKVHDNNNFSMSSIGGGGGGGGSLLSGSSLFHRANQLYNSFSSPFRSNHLIPKVVQSKPSSGKKRSTTTTTNIVPMGAEGLAQYQAPVEYFPQSDENERVIINNGGLRRRGRSTGPSSSSSTTTMERGNTSIPSTLSSGPDTNTPTKAQTYKRIALILVAIFLAIVVYVAVKNLLQIYRQHVLDTNISGKLRTLRGIVDCETPYGQSIDIEKARIPILTLRKEFCSNIVTDEMCNSAIQTIINNKDFFNVTNIIGVPMDHYFPRSSLQKYVNDDSNGNGNELVTLPIVVDDVEITLLNMDDHYGSEEQHIYLHANEPAAIWTWNCKIGKAYDNIAYPVAAWRDRTLQWLTNVFTELMNWFMENWIVTILLTILSVYAFVWLRSSFITKRNEAMINHLWTEAKNILEQRSNGISADLLPDLVIAQLYGDKHTTEGQRASKLWSFVQKRLTNDKRIAVTTVQDSVTGVMHDAYIIRSSVGYLSPGTTSNSSSGNIYLPKRSSPSTMTSFGGSGGYSNNNNDNNDGNDNNGGTNIWNLQSNVRGRAYSGSLL